MPPQKSSPSDPTTPPGTVLDAGGQPASDTVISLKLSELSALVRSIAQEVNSGGGGGSQPDGQLAQALIALNAMKNEVVRNHVRSNSISEYYETGKSDFAPEGFTSKDTVKLKYRTWYLGDKMKEENLTPSEIHLFNSFTTDKSARNGSWTATITNDGSQLAKLSIECPIGTMDNRWQLPSLSLILQELLGGRDSLNPDSLLSRVADLEAMIEKLKVPSIAAPSLIAPA